MNYGGHFDSEKKEKRIKELEEKTNDANFWNDKKESERVISELNNLKKVLEDTKTIKEKIESNIEILKEIKQENDSDMLELLEEELNEIEPNLENLELSILLSGPYDKSNCILELHSGAGGTEACDWALMLERMYLRYSERHNYKTEILDEQPGDEAGIKSASIIVKGINAYGYLKNEKGVHRLVRLSPFDSNNRRHTSFASVDVIPIFENNDIDIEINQNDLRIDTYRSSGKGGQGVNTTDSAVRITHLPTNIVVTCQNERSQIQNKEKALEVLKSKLYQLELEKKKENLKEIKGENKDINFGSGMRSYVMHPYSMVKDNRTKTETSDVSKVLDGYIDEFINDNLKRGN